jgi:hypothetical protein
MKMKKSFKLLLGMCLAIGLAIVLTGCYSTKAKTSRIGTTLDETLGKPLAELQKMLGTTQAEFESLLGRKLKNYEFLNYGYVVQNYPKSPRATVFYVEDRKVTKMRIATFDPKAFYTIVEQVINDAGVSLTSTDQVNWIGDGISIMYTRDGRLMVEIFEPTN